MKKLSELLHGILVESTSGSLDTEIRGLAYDSRKVEVGTLFCTWKGEVKDGAEFIPAALERGASAFVLEHEAQTSDRPAVVVRSGRRALSLLAANFYDHPGRKLKVIGVTGTNGKTSSSFLIRSLLEKGGIKTGLLGTIQYHSGIREVEASRTTPEGLELQRFLGEMVDNGCGAAVMEVSSHALAQDRVAGLDFGIAIFTNLSRDHLDFHGTMENYFEAKLRLFRNLRPGQKAVINVDDGYGLRVVSHIPAQVELLTYGLEKSADYRAEQIELSPRGTKFLWRTPEGTIPVEVPWVGTFNVMNVLAAATTAVAAGFSVHQVAQWLPEAPPVPGRMEPVLHDGSFAVLVDYAHTDDAVAKVLESLRAMKPKRLRILVGCGGDRDKTKRPIMAKTACRLADEALFTSDNPRSEKPQNILDDMLKGVDGYSNFRIIEERAEAIGYILQTAETGDVIVLAGKGHEATQEIAGVKYPFSDQEVAGKFLSGGAQ